MTMACICGGVLEWTVVIALITIISSLLDKFRIKRLKCRCKCKDIGDI